jgi:arsenate reductase
MHRCPKPNVLLWNVETKKVLFLCVHNAGRSQTAEALFNQMAKGRARSLSARTQPSDKVNPVVIEGMRELGLDIDDRRPKMLSCQMLQSAGWPITMGCGVENACAASFVPSQEWQIEDPERKSLERVRQIGDEIRARVKRLVEERASGNG